MVSRPTEDLTARVSRSRGVTTDPFGFIHAGRRQRVYLGKRSHRPAGHPNAQATADARVAAATPTPPPSAPAGPVCQWSGATVDPTCRRGSGPPSGVEWKWNRARGYPTVPTCRLPCCRRTQHAALRNGPAAAELSRLESNNPPANYLLPKAKAPTLPPRFRAPARWIPRGNHIADPSCSPRNRTLLVPRGGGVPGKRSSSCNLSPHLLAAV